MIIVQVYVKVLENCIPEFIEATRENAESSLSEEGVVRFDFMQARENKTAFLLTEIYKDDEAPLAHKKTTHYLKWRETVAPMMAEPRKSEKYTEIFPQKMDMWKTPNG